LENIPQMIANRRKALRKSWRAFQAFKCWQISEVIRRSKAKLPRRFVPWAPGLVIASDRLLSEAGYGRDAGSQRPKGWRRLPRMFGERFMRAHPPYVVVRKHHEFWIIEWSHNVLVFTFGSMPVCTRSLEAAMRLADFYVAKDRLAYSLRWVPSDSDGILDC